MDNMQSLRKIKLLVRIIGVLFASMGVIGLVSTFLNWSTASPLTLAFSLLVNLLTLVGGGLLLAFRHDGLEIAFVILRLYILLGLGTIVGGVLVKQLSTAVFGSSILAITIGLMMFLSQNNVKSLFRKKEID